jgi:hypothetical protein
MRGVRDHLYITDDHHLVNRIWSLTGGSCTRLQIYSVQGLTQRYFGIFAYKRCGTSHRCTFVSIFVLLTSILSLMSIPQKSFSYDVWFQ